MSKEPAALSFHSLVWAKQSGNGQLINGTSQINTGHCLYVQLAEQPDHYCVSSWAEANGLRAAGQAGFRRDHYTTDNVFILRSLIESCKAMKTQRQHGMLYTCFVDFRKAFDPGTSCGNIRQALAYKAKLWML